MQQLVSEFLDSLINKKYAPNSIQSHRLDLRKFLKWLEVDEDNFDSQELLEKIRRLSLEDLETYLNYLRQSYKPRTLARHRHRRRNNYKRYCFRRIFEFFKITNWMFL